MYVRIEKIVTHEDRDVEFIQMKWALESSIAEAQKKLGTEEWSCEQWAHWLLRRHSADLVEVSEDGENGAVVEVVQ